MVSSSTVTPRSRRNMEGLFMEGPSRKLTPPAVIMPVAPVTSVPVALVLVVSGWETGSTSSCGLLTGCAVALTLRPSS